MGSSLNGGDTDPEAARTRTTAHDGVVSRTITALARWCVDHAAATIALYLVIAGLSAAYTAANLKIDTDPTLMISNDLPFSQSYHAFARQFPALRNSFLIVVDSPDPGEGRAAAGKIADALKRRPDLFSNVFAPGNGAYFDRYGVLYLDEPAVKKLAAELKQLVPVISTLSLQPDLAGLDDLFKQIAPAAQTGRTPAELAVFLGQLSRSVEASTQGKSSPLDWTAIYGDRPAGEETRWFVFAKPVLDFSAINAAARPIAEIRRLLAEANASGSGVRTQLTGKAALNAEEFELVTKGAAIAMALSFTLVTITVIVGLPSLVLLVPTMALLVLGFLINAGFATLSVGYLNMITVAFAILFIGLGIDYAVHVVLRFAEERAKGQGGKEAALTAISNMALPLSLCTLTTSLAFLAFVPTDFDGMAQLGIIGSSGIVIAFVASITLVPAILSLLPGPQEKIARKLARRGTAQETGAGESGWPVRKIATPVLLVLAALSAWLLPQARFDGDPINLKDPAAPSMIAFNDVIARHPDRVYGVHALSKPGKAMDALIAKLKSLPEVADVKTIATAMPEDQRAKLEHLNGLGDVLPPSILPAVSMSHKERRDYLVSILGTVREIARADGTSTQLRAEAVRFAGSLERFISAKGNSSAAVKSLQSSLVQGFPKLFANARQLADIDAVTLDNVDKSLKERYVTADGRWRLEIVPKGDMRDAASRSRFVQAVTAVHPGTTGAPVDISGSADVVASAMRLATLTALGLVIVVLFPILRRVRDVMLVMVPLVLAGTMVVGYTVAAGSPFNFANVIVLPLLLGLGVDSAIHYVMRAREEKVATDVTGTSTPRAVLISAVTTMGSFGTLWLAPHRGMASMGELLTVAIVVTLLCTLIVLPQLIAWSSAKTDRAAAK